MTIERKKLLRQYLCNSVSSFNAVIGFHIERIFPLFTTHFTQREDRLKVYKYYKNFHLIAQKIES